MSNPFEKYLEASQRQYANHEYNIQAVRDLMPQIEPVKSLEGSFPKSKTFNDYVGDTAVDATKAAMTSAQTGISALDAGAYALDAVVKAPYRLAQALAPDELEPAYPTEYGQFSKLLNDNLGFNIGKAKQTLGELGYSDIRKKQEAELHTGYSEKEIEAFKNQWTNQFSLQYQDLANKGANKLELEAFKSKFEDNYKQAYTQMMDKYQTSWDKSLGENAAILGKAFDTVLDNPALGFGAAIESSGYLVPSLAVSRGIAALQGAKLAATAGGKAVAAGIGEGLVSALALNEQMRGNSATGTIDGTKVAAGFAGGALTALIGGVSNRLGSRFGLDDVDSLVLGTQAKGFSVTRPVLATGQEAGEEFLQGFGESIIPNIAEGKDPLQGLAQELALGTVAGGIMGATTNARSLVSGAGSDLVSGFNKVAEAVGKGKDAITAKTFEELNDPTNKNYDPAKAFNSQVPKINSQDDREREEALANMESVFGNLETHRSNLINEKDIAEGILKNIAALPPEEQAKNLKAKGQAESLIKDLDARIIAAENQTMDLFEQKFTLGKNQEVQAGVPQYSEEQAKQDIEVLSQQPTTAVWRNQDTDLPVTVLGETQVDEAGQEYTKVSYTDAATGSASENYVPTSELVQDTTTQQEAVDRVTKHFSKLSLDELDTVAKSPYLSEEQRNSLRYLSETKRAIADMADTGTVTHHIMNGLKGKTAAESHRGLNNYSDMISEAISTKDEKLLNVALNDLGRFAQDHTDKANALVQAHQLAVSGKFPNLQVLRPKNGTWGIVTDPSKFVDDVKRTATGGWNVHRNTNNNGSIDAVTKEATLIQDTLKSLTQVSLSFGLQAVEPTVTAPVSIEALKEANKPVTPPTPTGDGNNVPTPVSKRVKGHRAHIEVDGKHTYELTDSDVTYHYVWDTDNNELRVYSIRLTRDKETNKVIDHRLAAVDPITGSTFALLSGGNKDILITPESVLSSVIAGGVTVQGYAQNPGKLTQEQRDKTNTDLTSKAIKKRIAIEEESIAMFAEMGITTGPQIDKINARIKELKALLNSVPLTPDTSTQTEATETISTEPKLDAATPAESVETVADSEQQLSSLTKTASDTVKLPSDYGQSDIFKAVPLFKKENPTGIIAFRVNSKRTLLESLKDANAIGNPFNWQNPKIGAGNATKMFDEWLRTGKHTDHAEAPQATEEYRQAILSKLKENPTAKILYYKELNGASHANVLERIAKDIQQSKVLTPTPSTQAEATEAVNDKAANGELSNYINHSGGAIGSDTAWGEIGAKYGVTSNHYYKDKTPNGNVQITLEQLQEGLVKAKEAAKALGRNWSSKPYVQGLLARNWQQVKNADAIFAVAELEGKYVKGGTGYAVAMAVAEGKPVYVFDQSKNSWFKHTGTGWQKTDTPTLTPNFAGIGTRELNAVGVQAIKEVYSKTLKAVNAEPQLDITTPVEAATAQPKEKVKTAESVQESKPTHNVPKNILNKLRTAKHIVGDLLSVSNGVFNTKEAKYAVDLLTALIGLKDSVLVMLSDNIGIIKEDGTFENETISEEVQSKMLNNNIGYALGNKIYVKLNHKATVDTLQVLVHEYHHAVTAEFLDSIAGNAEHPINKALHGIRKAVEAHLDSGAKMSPTMARRLEYAITNFKELITVGTTETSVIAHLRAVKYGDGSIFDALVKQNMAILESANPTTFNQLKGTLNDVFNTAKESVISDETSSTNSPNDSAGEAANTGSQESGDNSTESIIEDTTSTGQASGEATTVTNQTEVEDGKVTDGRTGTGNTSTESQQTSTESQEVTPLKPEFQGKVILAHAGTGKSFATKSNPDLIDGDVLYYQATNTIVDKYNKEKGETVPNIKDVTGTKGVFTAWGEYDKTNPQRQAEAVRRRNEIYQEYANQARALADAGKTVLSSSIRKELIDVADMVVIQDDAAFIGKNLTSAERVNQNSETDLVKIQGKINKAKDAASNNPNLKVYTLEKGQYISALIFESNKAEEVEDGKVTVLQGVTEAVREEERRQPFSVRNLIKAYFTQKKGDASNSPLVLVKDFISNLNVANALSKYLSDDTKVNAKQVAQVEHFQKFAKNIAPVITRVFQGEFSKDPKNNLVRDLAVDGVLDENILTAIAVAAYGYLIRYSEPYNTDDSIRDIVRITKDDAIPPQVAQLLRYAGQEAPYVEADLGKEIAKLLGLKALDDSSADLQSRLEKALGSLTTAALNDVGYASVHTDVSHKAIGYLMRNAGYTGNEASGTTEELEGSENLHALETLGKLTFIRVNYKVDDNAPVIAINKAGNIDPVKVLRPARNKDGLIIIKPLVWGTDLNKTSPNDLSDILKNSEETKGILDKVFNNDVGYIKPLMVEPEALDAKTKQGTNNSISKTQKELVEEGQKTAFSIRANTVNVLRTLKGLTDDSKLLKQLLGIWVDDDTRARTHVTDRESLEAKANNEWRTLTNGLEWADYTSLGNDEYAEFYDAQYITQNERMQYLSNLFNMQASQIHRAMASLAAFKLEIDLTDISSANKNLQRFYQAVGEGLEKLDKDLQDSIKKKAGLQQFFTVDKVSADNYVESLTEYLYSDISINAIYAMVEVLEGKTPTDTEQSAIALFVEKGGMGIQSLQSLIALAEIQIAIDSGQTSFTTTIGLGSDGVNNGVATANILTGVITREMKQQVGMLPKIPTKNDPTPFADMQEVYAHGKPDYYISFGAVMGRFLGLLRDTDTEKNKIWRDSVQALFPLYKAIQEASLEMRKIAKTWSIPFNYGAGKKSLQRALARGFMSGIYSDINGIANEALDLEAALNDKEITKDIYDVDMAALRLKANTLQDNINNILRRGWSEGKDKNGNTIWKTAFRIQFPKDLTKLNDYNFDEAQVGQMSYGKMVFEGDAYKGTSKDIVYSLTQAVTALHGQAAWKATEEYAREYTKVRDLLNTTHTATYMLYENMRTDLIQAKLRAKREEAIGAIEKRNKEINASNDAIIEEYKKQGKDALRKAQSDSRWEDPTIVKDLVKEFEYLGLTTEELREIDSILKPVAPVLHSALSRETNNLNAGITLATTEDKVGKASDNKQVATSYVNKYTKKPRYNTSGLSFKAEMSSGIKALAMAVQGIDAYVAAYLQAKFPTLNVHDAGIFGLKYFVEATKYQNEIYLQAMVNYHLNTESVEALMRSYLGLKDFIASLDSLGLDETAKAKFINQIKIVEDNILNRVAERNPDGTVKLKTITNSKGKTYEVEDRKGVFKGLNKAFEAFGMLPKENLIEALQALILQAIQQDLAKLESLKDLKSVHQYSGEGGAFIIGGKGSDLSEAEHLRRIDAQIALLKVKEKTLLQQLEREVTVLDLVSGKNTKDTSLITFLNANKGKEVDVKDIVTILKGDSSLARNADVFQQQLAIIREIAPLLDGVKVIYEDVANNEEEGIDDYVQGFYNEDTNRITIRANSKYPPTAKLVLHELLHSGLAARITYLQNLPKDSEEYQDARVALQRLESLRKEILSNLVEGVDASKYFELEAAFKGVGGWEAYKKAQESLKNNKEYQGALTRIETLKKLLKEALQKRKEQNTQFTTLNSMYEEYSEALKNIPFNTDEYSKVWLQQQDTLDAIKQLKEDQQETKKYVVAVNEEIKKLNTTILNTEFNNEQLNKITTAKAFLKLHNTLKNTVFTINGTTEINGLTVVNQLIDIHEFISYGLTEQYLQDIMEAVVQVKNTAERKGNGLRGYWGIFVKAIGRILKIGKGETIDALSAFAMDVANTIKAIRESNVPRAEATTPTIRKSTTTQPEDQVNQMSSIEVMQTLPHTGNSDFGLHLNSLAEKVISQVYNNDEVAKAQIDVIQAIRALPAIKAGFNLSQREAAIQHSLELVLQTYLETSKGGLNVGQLWKIYAEAQKNIKVSDFYDGDWSKATAQERAATQQKYNYVMNSSGKGVESLARFISMGLATEEVHNLLGFNTVTAKPSKQKSWFDTLNAWVRYIASWLGGKLVKTSPLDPAYKQLQGLVNNLTALDIRNRQAVVSIFDKAWNLVGKATQPLDTAVQKLRQYATNRDFLRNSKYLPLRTLGSIASLDAKAIGETIPALIRETRDKARPNEKLGEAMTALMESTAMSAIRKSMEALIRQANLNAKDRQDRNDNVKKAIMAWFKDNGKHISKEMHKAITYTLLRTDAQSLLTTFGLDKTIGLLLDTNKLKNEIDLVTKDVSQYKNGNSMINQAMRLAYYMVTNKGGLSLSKNPTAIAMGLGTNYQIDLEDVDQALVGQLDVLVSLFAMKYTSAKDRKVLGEMYKENPEALQGLLNMHKGFMSDAETEFKDNPLNYIKGWMPEIVNPYREVRTASGIDERDQMLKEGWKVIEEIKPYGKFLMVHADIGYQRLVSGAVDLQNSHRKGTEIVNRQSKQYLSTVKANLAYSAHIASIPHTQFDPSKQETGLIPTYDTDGVPMAFNYEMASWVRDKEMERNNNFADLMGSYAGAMFYKPAKRKQSVTVANALFEDYKQNYQKHPNSYIKLSGKSSDPRIVEMWRMLPKDFRQRATELYGKGEPIVINNEAFLLAFGFKKWSITNIWNKPESERTPMETMFVTMADNILKGTAKAKIAKAGHIWTEAVSKAKDFIVIRSISVLWHNVLSNGLMLMAYGINPITIAKEWTFATANVRAYQTLHSELIQLKANTLAGKGSDATEAQIKRIESQLEANPMSKYINEGLLSSIVEDVTIQQGDYTYDSELKKKIDNVTGWMPDSVKTLGAWAVLSPSTKAYQFLATTTQLSDFVAKVTLAKHLESKGMDFKAAISEASQTFINYDVPQGVGMQYMNDIGLFMFTKFFLRIQAILFKLLDKKAATVLAQHIAVESLTDIQGILAPSAAGSIGNWPFEGGALTLPGAAMSIAPVNAGFGLAGF